MSTEILAWIIPALLGYIIYQLDFIVKRLADIQILGAQIRDKKDQSKWATRHELKKQQ